MRNVSLFTVTAVTTAAICTAMHLGAADGKLLAMSIQPIGVGGAEVTGVLESRLDGGVYGTISITNRSGVRAVGTLNHATFNTPGSNPFARMMPFPRQKHSGTCAFDLASGESTHVEFCVQEPRRTASVEAVKPLDPRLAGVTTAPQWSLVISRGAITQPVFGGSLTKPQGSLVLPEAGVLVLAHTVAASSERISTESPSR